jgi:molecular chaperone HtpG
LLNILSQSLYQHKEIFLRELISNSSDALKKLHFISLQNKDINDPDAKLKIDIILDKITNQFIISDSGVGMTKEELINNLGTIAGSGSERFLKELKTKEEEGKEEKKEIDLDIIGQFGIGFYSIFMVADKVEVNTKSYNKDQPALKWTSDGSGEFQIEEVEKETRGTQIVLYLKEEDLEFLNQHTIETVIKKYSNFVPYPIFVEEIKKEEPGKKILDAEEIEDDDSKDGKKDDVVDVKEEPKEPEPVNEIQPLWKKNTKDITDDDYKKFYHFIAKRYDDYSHVVNYKVDGIVQFNSIMFLPEARSKDLMKPDTEYGLALYSKNVLIMQKCKEIMPQWMRFVQGVVDSEDIPLNISRETIQTNKFILKIEKLIVKKIMSELENLAENEPDKFKTIWKEFGDFIKEGIVTDHPRQEPLMKFLRFNTIELKSNEIIGLDEYIKNMKEDQTDIFYLIGDNPDTIKLSPHLGYYNEKGIDVILFTDPIDNFLMMNIRDYKQTIGEGDDAEVKSYLFKPIDVTDAKPEAPKDVDKKDEDKKEEEKDEDENLPEPTKKFLAYVKDLLGADIIDAKVSDRLYGNACRLANMSGGMTSSMQRAMRYWSQNNIGKGFDIPKKIMEFNPEHPIVDSLIKLYEKDPKDGKIKPVIKQMFENCLLSEGDLPNPSLMVPRINQLLEILLTGNSDVKNLAEELSSEDESEEPDKEDKAVKNSEETKEKK